MSRLKALQRTVRSGRSGRGRRGELADPDSPGRRNRLGPTLGTPALVLSIRIQTKEGEDMETRMSPDGRIEQVNHAVSR